MRRGLVTLVLAVLVLAILPAASSAATTTVDCDAGANLQAAIDTASSGDEIIIRGRCQGPFEVLDKSLRLVGRGDATILGTETGVAALTIGVPHTSAPRVTVKGLRITGSRDPIDGYGLVSWGHVVVESCHIYRNNKGLRNGGASMTVRDSLIANNVSDGIHFGYTSGEVLDTIIRSNGHGITSSHSTVTVRDSTVVLSGPKGHGTGLRNKAGTMTVVGSRVARNTAHVGAGIYNARDAKLVVRDSVIAANVATREGGGIYSEAGGAVTLVGVTFRNNAPEGGLLNAMLPGAVPR